MGIDGMTTFWRENKHSCFEQVNLVKIAAESPNGITLLVDYNCLRYDLYAKLMERYVKYQKNPYLALLNGEYTLLHSYITRMIESLSAVGINLVWYVDGARGSCATTTKFKLKTWKHRLTSDVIKMKNMLLLAKRKTLRSDNLEYRQLVQPPLLYAVTMEAIRSAGCTIIQCVSGDADYAMARDFHSRKYANAYAILSSDSDFCVFAGARLLPSEYFDMVDHLGLRIEGPHQPSELICYVTDPDRMVQAIRLENRSQLIDVATLCGNDFTKPFITQEFRRQCRARLHSVPDRAAFVRQYGSLCSCPAVARELARRSDLREAFNFARAYYELELPAHLCEQAPRDADESELIYRIESLYYPCAFLPIHKYAVDWSNVSLTDCTLATHTNHFEPLEVATRPLRCVLYRSLVSQRRKPRADTRFDFLLDDPPASSDTETENSTEGKRECTSAATSVRVGEFLSCYFESNTTATAPVNNVPVWITVELDGNIPHFSDIDQIDLDSNRRLFTEVINRLVDEYSEQFRRARCDLHALEVYERRSDTDYFRNGSRRRGYMMFVMKLFVHMNSVANLCVNKHEIRALFCTTLGAADERLHTEFSRLRVQPTSRSITIGTWFQIVYYYVRQIASLLFLEGDDFPKAHTVFSGAVWTGFCSLVHNKMRTALTDEQMDLLIETREKLLTASRRKLLNELTGEYFDDDSDSADVAGLDA